VRVRIALGLSAALALGAIGGEARAETVEETVRSVLQDRRYRFCHEDDYPLTPDEHAWCPIVGEASPLSPRLDWEVMDEGVDGRGTFGAAYEGPPGFVHGGWIACAFDEMLGIANIAAGNPGMTARLTVHYRRPTPLFRELRFRAWVDRVEGRRIMSRAEVWDGDVLTAEADGIFVQPRPELAERYFGPRDH